MKNSENMNSVNNKDFKVEIVDSSIKGKTVYLAIRRTDKKTGEVVVYWRGLPGAPVSLFKRIISTL